MRLTLIFFTLLFSVHTFAQTSESDLELAEYYYSQGQYEQAKLYYEKIYKTNRTTKVYTNYLNTLIALNDFEEAEKLVKKKIKTDEPDGMGYANLGDLYKKFGKLSEAVEQFDLAVAKMTPSRNNAVRLANEFIRINEYEYALAVYDKARTNGNDGYSYSYEVANLQGIMGNYEEMTDAFMSLLLESPNYLQTVQNSLNRTLNFEENPQNLEILKSNLLRRVQKYPDQTIYTEMLVWLFVQKKDFASAYVQATALDKRMLENGSRLINLADLSLANRDYSTAKKSYQYVIDKGSAGEYYVIANIEKLRTISKELEEVPGLDPLQYAQLESDYKSALNAIGKNADSVMLMKDLAHLQAFYQHNLDSSSALLEEAIAMAGVYDKVRAVCKLELGDIEVLRGEVWDASLLYQQVELDFKEDPLGHDAKFRNAKVYYYTGDFEFAQAQLDVLKASTSKLISNDAIDLSLLITDNFNMDTITTPMEMFARADLLFFQNKYAESVTTLDSIVTEWPMHSLADDILMMKGDIYFKQAQFELAKDFYQKVVDLHFMDITADDALFKLADMNEYIFLDLAKAMELYEKLMTDFPGSLYVVDARKRFRELRGDQLN